MTAVGLKATPKSTNDKLLLSLEQYRRPPERPLRLWTPRDAIAIALSGLVKIKWCSRL